MSGTQLSGRYKGKGKGLTCSFKDLGCFSYIPFLMLSSTRQVYALTFFVLIRKQRLWEVSTAQGPTSLLCCKAPSFFLSLYTPDSESSGKTEAVPRERISSVKYLRCGNVAFEGLHAWLASMKTSRTEDRESIR